MALHSDAESLRESINDLKHEMKVKSVGFLHAIKNYAKQMHLRVEIMKRQKRAVSKKIAENMMFKEDQIKQLRDELCGIKQKQKIDGDELAQKIGDLYSKTAKFKECIASIRDETKTKLET